MLASSENRTATMFFLKKTVPDVKQKPDIKKQTKWNQEIDYLAAVCNGLTWHTVFIFQYTCKSRLAFLWPSAIHIKISFSMVQSAYIEFNKMKQM